ncbi:MAG: HyaD/HybD family hydrogenase maturation endopeptidase [Thermoanaerobaculales bacterium]|jgi:hydrogenase maturation protease|nr:HyaD/HybD family hydrogenase maturation endopeptidase [Thermoanaerobaculales bacterium]
MTDAPAPIRIVGIGNVLMGDDGLGPYAVEILTSRYEFPEHVEVVDGGTPGLDFLPYVTNARSVIVLDTVASDGEPGTLKIYRNEEIIGSAPPPRLTPHQPGLREALMAAELTDSSPQEMVLLGVVPSTLDQGTRLSDPVQNAVEPLVQAVVEELNRLDADPTPRDTPLEPALWWI